MHVNLKCHSTASISGSPLCKILLGPYFQVLHTLRGPEAGLEERPGVLCVGGHTEKVFLKMLINAFHQDLLCANRAPFAISIGFG